MYEWSWQGELKIALRYSIVKVITIEQQLKQ